jgi:hypothetical protein
MRFRYLAATLAAALALAACTEAAEPGAVRDADPTAEAALYSPVDRSALALGLPDLIGSHVLVPANSDDIEHEEDEFCTDSRVRQLLVARGLGPSAVTLEQKSAVVHGPPTASEQIPRLALAAAQIKGVPAVSLMDWDPTFYLLLTSVDVGDYLWQGEKPDGEPATIAGRDMRVADFGRFQLGWYAYGDVLYVVVAEDLRTLEDAVERLPWSTFMA